MPLCFYTVAFLIACFSTMHCCVSQNIYAAGIPSPHKAQGQNNTVQCKAYTKAGTRCKHQTSIGNGFCYQHQSK